MLYCFHQAKSTPDVDSKRDGHIYDTLPESSGKDGEKKILKSLKPGNYEKKKQNFVIGDIVFLRDYC